MRRISTLTATSLSAALVLTSLELVPATAFAQEPAAGEAAEDPKLAEARKLYGEGEVKFKTAEYEEALVLWKRAFAILEDSGDTRAIRNALVYNIAEAHSRAYEVSRNPTHLRKAKILLEDYRTAHRELYGDEPDAVKERAEADDRIAELEKQLAESEAKGETSTPINEGTPTEAGEGQVVPPPRPLTPSQQWDQDVKADPVLGPQWQKGGKQVGGGAVMVGIGGVFTLVGAGLIVAGIGLRVDSDPLFNGTGALVTGSVFGLIGIGLLVPGAIVLAKGVQNRKAVLKAKPRPSASLLPTFDPKRGSGGVSFTVRF